MPQLVAGLIASVCMGSVALAAVVLHVADGAEVDDLAGLAEGDVLCFRLTQPAGECEVSLVGHLLVRKAEHRIGVDRYANLCQRVFRDVAIQRHPGDPRPEVLMQGFDLDQRHAGRVRPAASAVKSSRSLYLPVTRV